MKKRVNEWENDLVSWERQALRMGDALWEHVARHTERDGKLEGINMYMDANGAFCMTFNYFEPQKEDLD